MVALGCDGAVSRDREKGKGLFAGMGGTNNWSPGVRKQGGQGQGEGWERDPVGPSVLFNV